MPNNPAGERELGQHRALTKEPTLSFFLYTCHFGQGVGDASGAAIPFLTSKLTLLIHSLERTTAGQRVFLYKSGGLQARTLSPNLPVW